MLELRDVSAGYRHGPVIHRVGFTVERGEAVALLGPNGAGKSTLLAAISGLIAERAGSIRFDGVELSGAPTHRVVRQGLVQVPEGRRMFAPLTVEDNLRLGATALPRASRAAECKAQLDRVYALFPPLAARRRQRAGTLSGGEQQMVAIGRALMSRPRLLLLDEPFLGLAPKVIEQILAALAALRGDGLTMLLVEQKLDIALPFTQRALVMIKGRIVLTQTSQALARRPDLDQLYFQAAG